MNASRLRHLSYRALGASELHLRYIDRDPELESVLGRRPRDVAELLEMAPVGAPRLVEPGDLADALDAYARRHEAPAAVLEAAEKVRHGALAVVTGQQPGLFGGPIYTVLKAATAVRLAREIGAQTDRDVVAVFWNHSDDHDLDEVNRAFVINPNQDVQRLRLPIEHTGEMVRDVPIGHLLEQAIGAAADVLPATEFKDAALELMRLSDPDQHFGDHLARILFGLFGEQGLLVVEPRDMPASAFEVLTRWWRRSRELRGLIPGSIEHVSDLGLDVTMDPGSPLMFQAQGQRRQPLVDGEEVGRAEELSPGVLLRPLWQDAVMPNIASVLGPGELSYMAVARPFYRALGVPAPVLVPRASLTIVEPSMTKLLERFGWDIPKLAVGPEALDAELHQDEDRDPAEDAIGDLADHLHQRLGEIASTLRERDQQMVGPCERARSKAVDELRKLQQRVAKARKNREGTGARQVRRLCANLRPRGRLQERVLSVLPLLVKHGPGLADVLLDAADPFAKGHGVLEL